MDVRKSAIDLTNDERDRFLEAIIRLKHIPAPDAPSGVSVYDMFVALHGAVMGVVPPGDNEPVNYGHWNIGFCPWHRQYLRQFELALQEQVDGVTLPYWDWTDHPDAINFLFTPEFLSSLNTGFPRPVADGVLREAVPVGERPAWWLSSASGFSIYGALGDGLGLQLTRGTAGGTWPPSASAIGDLERLVVDGPDFHPLWVFWMVLEQGHPNLTTATHNAGHNFIGGHMGRGFSPNDPIFWLHHANVDRIWANWQDNRLQANPGSSAIDHWPPPDELSPLTGEPAPLGHRRDDPMWPWVDDDTGYQVVSVSDEVLQMFTAFVTAQGVVRVSDVLDYTALGYAYAQG